MTAAALAAALAVPCPALAMRAEQRTESGLEELAQVFGAQAPAVANPVRKALSAFPLPPEVETLSAAQQQQAQAFLRQVQQWLLSDPLPQALVDEAGPLVQRVVALTQDPATYLTACEMLVAAARHDGLRSALAAQCPHLESALRGNPADVRAEAVGVVKVLGRAWGWGTFWHAAGPAIAYPLFEFEEGAALRREIVTAIGTSGWAAALVSSPGADPGVTPQQFQDALEALATLRQTVDGARSRDLLPLAPTGPSVGPEVEFGDLQVMREAQLGPWTDLDRFEQELVGYEALLERARPVLPPGAYLPLHLNLAVSQAAVDKWFTPGVADYEGWKFRSPVVPQLLSTLVQAGVPMGRLEDWLKKMQAGVLLKDAVFVTKDLTAEGEAMARAARRLDVARLHIPVAALTEAGPHYWRVLLEFVHHVMEEETEAQAQAHLRAIEQIAGSWGFPLVGRHSPDQDVALAEDWKRRVVTLTPAPGEQETFLYDPLRRGVRDEWLDYMQTQLRLAPSALAPAAAGMEEPPAALRLDPLPPYALVSVYRRTAVALAEQIPSWSGTPAASWRAGPWRMPPRTPSSVIADTTRLGPMMQFDQVSWLLGLDATTSPSLTDDQRALVCLAAPLLQVLALTLKDAQPTSVGQVTVDAGRVVDRALAYRDDTGGVVAFHTLTDDEHLEARCQAAVALVQRAARLGGLAVAATPSPVSLLQPSPDAVAAWARTISIPGRGRGRALTQALGWWTARTLLGAAARVALAELVPAAAALVPAAVAALSDRDDVVRTAASRLLEAVVRGYLLAYRPIAAAIPTVVGLLRDSRAGVRATALTVLAAWAGASPSRYRDALAASNVILFSVPLLRDEDGVVAARAEALLVEVADDPRFANAFLDVVPTIAAAPVPHRTVLLGTLVLSPNPTLADAVARAWNPPTAGLEEGPWRLEKTSTEPERLKWLDTMRLAAIAIALPVHNDVTWADAARAAEQAAHYSRVGPIVRELVGLSPRPTVMPDRVKVAALLLPELLEILHTCVDRRQPVPESAELFARLVSSSWTGGLRPAGRARRLRHYREMALDDAEKEAAALAMIQRTLAAARLVSGTRAAQGGLEESPSTPSRQDLRTLGATLQTQMAKRLDDVCWKPLAELMSLANSRSTLPRMDHWAKECALLVHGSRGVVEMIKSLAVGAPAPVRAVLDRVADASWDRLQEAEHRLAAHLVNPAPAMDTVYHELHRLQALAWELQHLPAGGDEPFALVTDPDGPPLTAGQRRWIAEECSPWLAALRRAGTQTVFVVTASAWPALAPAVMRRTIPRRVWRSLVVWGDGLPAEVRAALAARGMPVVDTSRALRRHLRRALRVTPDTAYTLYTTDLAQRPAVIKALGKFPREEVAVAASFDLPGFVQQLDGHRREDTVWLGFALERLAAAKPWARPAPSRPIGPPPNHVAIQILADEFGTDTQAFRRAIVNALVALRRLRSEAPRFHVMDGAPVPDTIPEALTQLTTNARGVQRQLDLFNALSGPSRPGERLALDDQTLTALAHTVHAEMDPPVAVLQGAAAWPSSFSEAQLASAEEAYIQFQRILTELQMITTVEPVNVQTSAGLEPRVTLEWGVTAPLGPATFRAALRRWGQVLQEDRQVVVIGPHVVRAMAEAGDDLATLLRMPGVPREFRERLALIVPAPDPAARRGHTRPIPGHPGRAIQHQLRQRGVILGETRDALMDYLMQQRYPGDRVMEIAELPQPSLQAFLAAIGVQVVEGSLTEWQTARVARLAETWTDRVRQHRRGPASATTGLEESAMEPVLKVRAVVLAVQDQLAAIGDQAPRLDAVDPQVFREALTAVARHWQTIQALVSQWSSRPEATTPLAQAMAELAYHAASPLEVPTTDDLRTLSAAWGAVDAQMSTLYKTTLRVHEAIDWDQTLPPNAPIPPPVGRATMQQLVEAIARHVTALQMVPSPTAARAAAHLQEIIALSDRLLQQLRDLPTTGTDDPILLSSAGSLSSPAGILRTTALKTLPTVPPPPLVTHLMERVVSRLRDELSSTTAGLEESSWSATARALREARAPVTLRTQTGGQYDGWTIEDVSRHAVRLAPPPAGRPILSFAWMLQRAHLVIAFDDIRSLTVDEELETLVRRPWNPVIGTPHPAPWITRVMFGADTQRLAAMDDVDVSPDKPGARVTLTASGQLTVEGVVPAGFQRLLAAANGAVTPEAIRATAAQLAERLSPALATMTTALGQLETLGRLDAPPPSEFQKTVVVLHAATNAVLHAVGALPVRHPLVYETLFHELNNAFTPALAVAGLVEEGVAPADWLPLMPTARRGAARFPDILQDLQALETVTVAFARNGAPLLALPHGTVKAPSAGLDEAAVQQAADAQLIRDTFARWTALARAQTAQGSETSSRFAVLIAPSAMTPTVRRLLLDPQLPSIVARPSLIVWVAPDDPDLEALQVRALAVATSPQEVGPLLNARLGPFLAVSVLPVYGTPEEKRDLIRHQAPGADLPPLIQIGAPLTIAQLLQALSNNLLGQESLLSAAANRDEVAQLAAALERYYQ